MISNSILDMEATQKLPFSVSEEGVIRISGTRVSLDSIVHHYQEGATAEEIALRFPAVSLANVHSALAYYLNHRPKVEEYIRRQRQLADQLERRIKADPRQQQGIAEMRERISRRKTAEASSS